MSVILFFRADAVADGPRCCRIPSRFKGDALAEAGAELSLSSPSGELEAGFAVRGSDRQSRISLRQDTQST